MSGKRENDDGLPRTARRSRARERSSAATERPPASARNGLSPSFLASAKSRPLFALRRRDANAVGITQSLLPASHPASVRQTPAPRSTIARPDARPRGERCPSASLRTSSRFRRWRKDRRSSGVNERRPEMANPAQSVGRAAGAAVESASEAPDSRDDGRSLLEGSSSRRSRNASAVAYSLTLPRIDSSGLRNVSKKALTFCHWSTFFANSGSSKLTWGCSVRLCRSTSGRRVRAWAWTASRNSHSVPDTYALPSGFLYSAGSGVPIRDQSTTTTTSHLRR